MAFHKTTYGMYGGMFRADRDGFVGLTAKVVQGLKWAGDLTDEQAEDIASFNRYIVERADNDLKAFRSNG